MSKKISLIVPCYNEESALPIFYNELSKVISSLDKYMFELVFVDDGSKDKTLDYICSLEEKDENVKYVSFSRNFGKEAAMLAGIKSATGDYVAIMDADMQDPPSLLPQMIDIIEKGDCDCVATRRDNRKGEPPIRSFFANCFYKMMQKISSVNIVNGARDFRLMSRSMVDAILSLSEKNRFSKGLFMWVGFTTYWISYNNVERAAGNTKWNFMSLLRYSIEGIVNFSDAPLYISLLFAILSGIGTIVSLFIKSIVSTGAILSVVLFLSTIELLCFAIIGKYIANIHREVKNRPLYVIRKTNIKGIK